MNDVSNLRFARQPDFGASLARTYPGMDVMRETLAIILAGGRGTRLSPLTDGRAKPSVHFGGKFRIIDFTLSNCVNSGIRRIGIATQYKAQNLIRHVQRGWSFLDGRFDEFIEILPAQQRVTDDWYRGTADAVFQNIDILRRHAPRVMLILAGDHVYKMDYGAMIAAHLASGASMTVACAEVPLAEADQLGVMEVDRSDRVIGFDEKPARPRPLPDRADLALGSMGIYAVDPDFLYEQLEADAVEPDSEHDFGHTIIPRLIANGCDIAAYRFQRGAAGTLPYWRDVGTLDAYWEANMDLIQAEPALDLYDRRWPIWTSQEQLPPAKFVIDGADHSSTADAMVSGGCIVSGSTVERSLLFSNVRVDKACRIEDAVILPNCSIGQGAVLRRVLIDKGTVIPPGLQAGIDLAADRQRFQVTDKGVTVITAAMLGHRDAR